MEPYDAEGLVTAFVDGDKRHRARIIQMRQSGDEFGREFLDRVEEAKPQIGSADMRQKVTIPGTVIRPQRPDKYAPATVSKNEMALPLRIVRLKSRHRAPNCVFPGRLPPLPKCADISTSG